MFQGTNQEWWHFVSGHWHFYHCCQSFLWALKMPYATVAGLTHSCMCGWKDHFLTSSFLLSLLGLSWFCFLVLSLRFSYDCASLVCGTPEALVQTRPLFIPNFGLECEILPDIEITSWHLLVRICLWEGPKVYANHSKDTWVKRALRIQDKYSKNEKSI